MTSTESATAQHDKLDVIRKLLAKADRAATPEEAESYTAKAMLLIARHGIDEALLANDQNRDETPTSLRIKIEGSYSHRKSDLVCWIGHAFGVQNVCFSEGRKIVSVVLYGFASDLERTELLYTSLLLQATSQVSKVKSPDLRWETTPSYRNSWFRGFASRVSSRIREAEENARQNAQVERDEAPVTAGAMSVALVLVARKNRVTAYRDELHPKLRTLKGSRLRGSGGSAGREAGDRADIGAKRVGGTRRAIN